MELQCSDNQFNQVFETENFILITEQAINGTWTVTGLPLSGNVNDLGFIDALIKVMARIKTVLRRVPAKGYDSLLQLDVDSQTAKLQNVELTLTPVEFRILHAFNTKPNNVWSRDKLMNKMYDDYREVSDRTVDSHVANLRKKLLASPLQHDFISSVYGMGDRFVLPTEHS